MSDKKHWDTIYETRQARQVSWFQEHAALSLQFIRNTGVTADAHILDVGGGASVLVDDLLNAGYRNLSVLDISATALHAAQARLADAAARVKWIEADITQLQLPEASVDVWHDRAVFHFLTDLLDRRRYVQTVLHAVKPGGHVIIATFAEDGPLKCSGLDIVRYRPDTLHQEFGAGFELLKSAKEVHHTPTGADQNFVYCYCRR
jgi:ubiquinone/menaquinone biosynthesis C-methylase UbiE